MAPAPAPPTSSRSRARNSKKQRGRRAGDAPTWETVLGAQRDAAAATLWVKASLEEKHRKLLGAKAEWIAAVGIEHNPVALGKLSLTRRWNINVSSWNRYLTSGSLPSRRTGAGGLKKKKKRATLATTKTESISDVAERRRASQRKVTNVEAFKQLCDNHCAQVALKCAAADVLAAEVARLKREAAQSQYALTKSERELATSERRHDALARGDLGSLTLSHKGREIVNLVRRASEEEHIREVAMLEKKVVQADRRTAMAEKLMRMEKAKREETERVNAKILERSSLFKEQATVARRRERQAQRGRCRAKVREERAQGKEETLLIERVLLMDELRERQKELARFKSLQQQVEKYRLEGATFADMLGSCGFGAYPDEINIMLAEMTAAGLSAPHVRYALRAIGKVVSPVRFKEGTVRIPSETHISNIRRTLRPLAQRFAAKAIQRAEREGEAHGSHSDATALGGQSFVETVHAVPHNGTTMYYPTPVVMTRNGTAAAETGALLESFDAPALSANFGAIKCSLGNLAVAVTDNANTAQAGTELLRVEQEERRDVRNAESAAESAAAAQIAATERGGGEEEEASSSLSEENGESEDVLGRRVVEEEDVGSDDGGSDDGRIALLNLELAGVGCDHHAVHLYGDSGAGGKLKEMHHLEIHDVLMSVTQARWRLKWLRRRETLDERVLALRRSATVRRDQVMALLLLRYPRLRGRGRTHSSSRQERAAAKAQARRQGTTVDSSPKASVVEVAVIPHLAELIWKFLPGQRVLLPAPLPPPHAWFLRLPYSETLDQQLLTRSSIPIVRSLRLLLNPKSIDSYPCDFESFKRACGKAFGNIRGAASDRKHYLNEEGPMRAWLTEENIVRTAAGKIPLRKWYPLRNIGKGTRQNIGVEFCVELLLNTEVMTRYLSQINRDNEMRNRLVTCVEFGLRCVFFQAEVLARAVIAVCLTMPLVGVASQINAGESFAMWGVARAAVPHLSAGTAHVAVRDGIAADLARVSEWYASGEKHRAQKRDLVLAALRDGSRVARLAKFILQRRGTAMVERIWGNAQLAPRDLSKNPHASKFSAVNSICESFFGQAKTLMDGLGCSFGVASGVAALKQSGVLADPAERAEKERRKQRKRDRNSGGGAAEGSRHNPAKVTRSEPAAAVAPYLHGLMTPEELGGTLRILMRRKAREAQRSDDVQSKKAQAKETLKRRFEEGAKQDAKQRNRAKRYKAMVATPRAANALELDAFLVAAETKARASCAVGGVMASGKVRQRALHPNKIPGFIEKARYAVLVSQLQLLKNVFGDTIPSRTLNGKAHSFAVLKEKLVQHLADKPDVRVPPPPPHVLAGYDASLAAAHTKLSRELAQIRARTRESARKSFFQLRPAEGRVHLAAGAALPPPVDPSLGDAGLGAGDLVWNPSAGGVYKIVAPDFASPDPMSTDLICLVYPVASFPDADEDAMLRNPGGYDGVLVCPHAHVLSWLDGLSGEGEES